MSDYPKKLEEVVEILSLLSDQQERRDILIDYAESFKEVPSEISNRPFPEENKVPFCESGAYVWTLPQQDGTLKLFFAVENPQGISARALCAILASTLSGEKPENIIKIDEDLIYKIFGESLSMGKNMGLTGIIQRVVRDAKKYLKNKIET
jgi:cysteine desulfuration protein SufE